jgi:hypothetical protein
VLELWMVASLAAGAAELTPEQQREDFAVLWDSLEKMHPSLDLYVTSDELEQAKASVRTRLDEPRSSGAFWTVLMDAVEPIGCGHTTVDPSEAALARAAGSFFPRDLVVIDDALYFDPRSHSEGGKLVSIQGMPAEEVLGSLRGLFTSDARTNPWKDHLIDAYTPYYLPFLFDEPSVWEVEVARDGVHETLSLEGADRLSTRHVASEKGRYEAHAIDLGNGERVPVSASSLRGRALLLVFDGFDVGELKREVLPALRLAARTPEVAGVLLDVRANGGGTPEGAFDLYGHLIDRPEEVYDQKLYRWPYFASIMEGGEDNRGYRSLTAEDGPWSDRIEGGRVDVGFGRSSKVRPRKPVFDGPVLALTSAYTFSTAADFAALVQRHGRGVTVGTTTGGSATLQTSGMGGELVLPHSEIRVRIPLSRSRLTDPEGRLGVHGVVPDYPAPSALEDLETGRDVALARALEVLRTEPTGDASKP